jgi:plasmid stabilization system protein ParE
MAASYSLTKEALNDIDSIWNFIANDKVSAANRVKSEIIKACRAVGRSPRIGSLRPEITLLPIRFLPVSRYPTFVVAYRAETKPVQILAILHGKRNLPALGWN